VVHQNFHSFIKSHHFVQLNSLSLLVWWSDVRLCIKRFEGVSLHYFINLIFVTILRYFELLLIYIVFVLYVMHFIHLLLKH
jgi:hypothetical protein